MYDSPLQQDEPSDVVSAILINETRWELSREDGKDPGYVLARLRWTAKELAGALRPSIAALLEADGTQSTSALSDALTVILRDARSLPDGFLSLVANRVADTNDEDETRKALWISAQICIDAAYGIKNLSRWLNGGIVSNSSRQKNADFPCARRRRAWLRISVVFPLPASAMMTEHWFFKISSQDCGDFMRQTARSKSSGDLSGGIAIS